MQIFRHPQRENAISEKMVNFNWKFQYFFEAEEKSDFRWGRAAKIEAEQKRGDQKNDDFSSKSLKFIGNFRPTPHMKI